MRKWHLQLHTALSRSSVVKGSRKLGSSWGRTWGQGFFKTRIILRQFYMLMREKLVMQERGGITAGMTLSR